jgi:hypothetical protein
MRHRFPAFAVALALLTCVASSGFAQSGTPSETLRVFESSVLKQQKAWKTDDWNDYMLDEIPYPAYSFAYPAGWQFNGYSVFVTSKDVKVAELAPGVVKLGPGQECFANAGSKKSAIPGRPIRVGQLRGRKVIGQFEDDYSGSIWHHVGYCLSDGEFAFLISFRLKHRNASMERQFARVVSSFRFIAKDGK